MADSDRRAAALRSCWANVLAYNVRKEDSGETDKVPEPAHEEPAGSFWAKRFDRDMTILSQKLSDTLQDAMRKRDSQMKSQFDETTGMSCWYLVTGCPNPYMNRLFTSSK